MAGGGTPRFRHVAGLLVVSVAAATVLAPALIPIANGNSAPTRVPCGVWRWDVKTLSDSHKHDVNFTPQAVTVQHLRTLQAPGSLGTNTPRIWPVEKKTYVVHAQVLKATIEDDSDIHLVIAVAGSSSQTMIVEFPDPHCVASAFKRPAIAAARAALLSNCGAISSSSFTNLTGTVDVSGVGFWDEIHGQTGVAPNGIELHPALRFTGTCNPVGGPPSPSPTPSPNGNCSPAYPDFCIPPPPPDLDCADVAPHHNFTVLPPDPHGFDGDHDGVGCEA